ncbi:hypothetical protein KBC75_03830 [Candidatus Shapirobacteria bacterium]|nr:hypothetical protein [Candidatus Shapirobacteria bacterium]
MRFIDRYRIESTRKLGWNYSDDGIYFITICTYGKNNFFGKISDGEMVLSNKGNVVKEEMLKTFDLRKYLNLIEWVIMPNHVHLLFSIKSLGIGDEVVNPHIADINSIETGFNFVETCFNSVETPGLASLPRSTKCQNVISGHRKYPNFYKKMGNKSKQIIPATIQQFKASIKRRLKKQNEFFGWQPGFYDEIVKDKKQLETIRYYIRNNVRNWEKDGMWSTG